MNIKETEKITGISKQNIRFYESNGLPEFCSCCALFFISKYM